MVHQPGLWSRGLSGCLPSPWTGCWGYYFHHHGTHLSSGGFLSRNWETCWCFTWGMTGWLSLGPDQAIIPDIEWLNRILLMMDIVNSGNLVEFTFFQEPHVQNWWRAWSWVCYQSLRNTVHKTKQPEEFLQAWAQVPRLPSLLLLTTVRSIKTTDLFLLLMFKRSKYPYLSAFFLPLSGRTVTGLFWCKCECWSSKWISCFQWHKFLHPLKVKQVHKRKEKKTT